MNLNRRNTIIGLGTIVAGGGAALGSGAFSTAEATRNVQVNVVDDADVIAEEFADVVIDPTDFGSIEVAEGQSVDNETYDSLDPSESEIELGDDAVSLIAGADDMIITFGGDPGDSNNPEPIPANSTVTYDDLFVVINDDGGQEFTVSFGFEDDDDENSNYELSFDSEQVGVGVGEAKTVGTTELSTGNDDDTDGLLTITVEEDND